MGNDLKKTEKDTFSHDIDIEVIAEFNILAGTLPGKKYELLEAMILAFKQLPEPLQFALLSARPQTREAAFAALASLQVSREAKESIQAARHAKAG